MNRSYHIQATPRLRGFTLVEVLIATLCFAIILTALNSTFYAAMRLRSRTVANVENAIPLNRTANIIRKDLQGIIVPSTATTGTVAGPFTCDPQGIFSGLGSGPNGTLLFCTSSGVISEIEDRLNPIYWSEVQQVAYYLKPSEFRSVAGMDLVRAVCRNLLPVITNLTDVTETRLMGGIKSMYYSFYDGTNWQTYWDSPSNIALTNEPPLPQIVKISLEFEDSRDDRPVLGPIDIEVPILVQGRTNQVASTASSASSGASGDGQTTGGGTTGGGTTGRGTTGGGTTGGGATGGSSRGGATGGGRGGGG